MEVAVHWPLIFDNDHRSNLKPVERGKTLGDEWKILRPS